MQVQNPKSSFRLRKTLFGKVVGPFFNLSVYPTHFPKKNPGQSFFEYELEQIQTFPELSLSLAKIEQLLIELELYALSAKERFLVLENIRKTLDTLRPQIFSAIQRDQHLDSEVTSALISIHAKLVQTTLATLQGWFQEGVRVKNPLFLACLHRCISASTEARFFYAIHFQTPPSEFWKSVNTLYRFIEAFHLEDLPIKQLTQNNTESTLQSEFIKINLLEIMLLPGLSTEETSWFFDFLEKGASLVQIKKYFSDNDLFVINLLKDEPPCYHPILPMKARGVWRAFEISPLIHFFQSQLHASLPILPPYLMQKLIQQWLNPETQFFPYLLKTAVVKTTVGLLNLFALASGHKSEPEKPQLCELIHMTPNGYCLNWLDTENSDPPKAGDVISIQSPEEQYQTYCIGSIRWLKRKADGQYQLGVQALAPQFTAAQLIIKSKRFCCQALMLPNPKALGEPSTLITPKLLLPTTEDLILKVDNKKYAIQLTRLLSSTAQYHQYKFKIKTTDSLKPHPKAMPALNPF